MVNTICLCLPEGMTWQFECCWIWRKDQRWFKSIYPSRSGLQKHNTPVRHNTTHNKDRSDGKARLKRALLEEHNMITYYVDYVDYSFVILDKLMARDKYLFEILLAASKKAITGNDCSQTPINGRPDCNYQQNELYEVISLKTVIRSICIPH